MDGTETGTRYQRPNSEQLEVNVELFSVVRKKNISVEEKVKKIKKLLGKIPQPDINAQDGNDNWNTALHLAIERNELGVVNFLLSQGADIMIENGNGKTSLELAEECNNAEIIDALKSFSQVEWPLSETDGLASHISQPDVANANLVSVIHSNSQAAATSKQEASTILPPFSGEIIEDIKLKLSDDNFKKSIEQFHAKKQLLKIDQLKATPPHPTTIVLAQFASLAYGDCEDRDPKTPDGWKLLTTATNDKNGYFGAAYWHAEYQQVVIAHRGTDTKNVVAFLRDLYTDIQGVLRNKYVDQINSASTFSNKVVAVLQEIEQDKKVRFEVFFTGHSLGGWLAQITTFTTEYLEVKGGTFLKKLKTVKDETITISTVQESNNILQSYHPHAVVFDSPGCKYMLSQMADKLDVRLEGRSIDSQHLDITSYLSAPNRINTCNSHLGTVYRIFTDLSGMGWKEKHTPLYNEATHSINKIVEACSPKKGKENDDKCEPKILEVVDWPVSKGVMGDVEYNDFFKWAQHLNDYHVDVMDTVHSDVPNGYRHLRYQTKAYDKCRQSLSIFTQDEREFLELYRWLRHVPEFFQLQDLFSELNNNEAEKEAEQILQDFNLDNEKIHCPDHSTLHILIPYVKRLVRLFPQLKDKAKEQLSSLQIRKRVYQYETQRNVATIDQSALDFNPGALGLREFLDSDQQIWQLRMIDGDAWTGLTKVYQALQKTNCSPNYSSKGHYTILNLERLETVNRMINLNTLLKSEMDKPHLLIIACGTDQPVDEELRELFRELIKILEEKEDMKIILTTESEDSTIAFPQQMIPKTFRKGVKTTDEKITWNELTPSSQGKIFEKKVIFQGRPVALNQLISAESMTDSFPLSDLLKEKGLRIGKKPVTSNSSGYNGKFYIDRTFNHKIIIRQDITIDKREGKFSDLLASTEQEFKQLCEQNPMSKVHWLMEDKSGELVWQQSQAKLKTLRKYIDAHRSNSYTPSDLDKLLQQAKNQRIMLIADKAGMGKSTVLTHLSKRIKENFPAHWLVRIDLNDYTELLKAHKGKEMDKGWVLEFVSKEVLKLESDLEKELFKKIFEGNGIRKVVVMVDGFDEVCPSHKETVIGMLQVLKQTSLEQLWVTTRHHLSEELEDNLQQFSYTLQPFSEVEQVEFLKKFWIQNSNLEDKDEHRLEIYAEALIRNLAKSISDKDKEFTGIPLQTRMLAEAFEKKFLSFYESQETQPELQDRLDLLGLYREFIDTKYDIYFEEKSGAQRHNAVIEVLRKCIFEQLQEKHQLLALETMFTEDKVTYLQIEKKFTFSDEELSRIGIAQRNSEGKLHFIHRTFAEYYVAEFLIDQLTKNSKQHEQVEELLVNVVLLKEDCKVIRAFLDGLLEKRIPTKDTLKEYGEKLHEKWNETEVRGTLVGFITVLHVAAIEDNANVIGLLLDSLKSGEHSNVLTKMLLAKAYDEETASTLAARSNSVQAMKKIWEWAEVSEKMLVRAKEEKLNAKKLKKKLLLAEDRYGYTAWHRAAESGKMQAFETLWSLAKELELNPHELLLAKNRKGYTAWQLAVKRRNIMILKKIWEWAREEKLNPDELKDTLLLAKDEYGYTAWHRAADNGSLEELETVCSWAKEVGLNTEGLLLAQSGRGYTALQMAVQNFHLEVLEKLCVWDKEAQPNTISLKNELLLAKGKYGDTAWHRAAEEGSLEALETLWSWAKEVGLNTEEVLLAQSGTGYTAWQNAVQKCDLEVLKKLWGWAKEAQVNEKALKNKLLLAEDQSGDTAWHRAAEKGSLEALETLWSWAKEVGLNSEEVLLAQSGTGYTAWQNAVQKCDLEVLEKLWFWAKEAQVNEKILKNKLLLAKDQSGDTAWHRAAEKGSLEALETLWSWAKEVELHPEYLLLAESRAGYTAWQNAVQKCDLEVLEKLWFLAKEAHPNTNELKNKLFLSKDRYGYTAWHRAAAQMNLEALKLLRSWAKEAEINPRELLLAQSEEGLTALHLAAERNHVGILNKLCIWSKEMETNTNELKIKLLLAKDKDGDTAWRRAVDNKCLKAFEILWSLAKEAELDIDQRLLGNIEGGVAAFYLAAVGNHVVILQELWVWAEKTRMNPNELKKKLLLTKDHWGYTAWHQAARSENVETLELLLGWAKEVQINPVDLLQSKNWEGNIGFLMRAEAFHLEVVKILSVWAKYLPLKPHELQDMLLRAKDKYGNTAWHQAAEEGNLEALETFWVWAKEAELNTDELLPAKNMQRNPILKTLQKMRALTKEEQLKSNNFKNKILLFKNKDENTAFHLAARRGRLRVLQKLWSWAKEAELDAAKLLLLRNKGRNTAWQLATCDTHLDVMKKLWELGKEAQLNPHQLLLAKDECGETAWHKAVRNGNLEALELLWCWAETEKLNRDDLKNKWLLAQNTYGETAWQMAAQEDNEVLMKLRVWAKEVKMNLNELKNEMLLSLYQVENSVWHKAAEEGRLQPLEIFWSWAKEAGLSTVEMKNKLLLAQNKWGETAWDIAASYGSAEILEKFWEWAKEVKLTRKELINKILLAKHEDGHTMWHRAAAERSGNSQVLDILCGWAKEAGLSKVEMKKLLLAKNGDGESVWNIAELHDSSKVLEKLWDCAEEVKLTRKEIMNIVLLEKDKDG